jgi:hypothetical protein
MLLRHSGAGFLAYGSSYFLHLPSRTTSGLSQVSYPFTVAGQRRTCTGFPRLKSVEMKTYTSTWDMLGRLYSQQELNYVPFRLASFVKENTPCFPCQRTL